MKKLSQMTTEQRKVRVAKLVKNPGTRHAVPTEYLPQAYRQKRELEDRLRAPVVQGSSLTNRDVARQANAGAEVKYGDVIRQGQQSIGQSEQAGKDMAGYFDDYQRKLAEAQGTQAQIGREATAGIGSLAGAFGAPDTAGLSAGNAADATNAATVRKAILANVGAVQTAQAGNANTYANQLANVVAPGQKLAAQAQSAGKTQSLREQLSGLVKEKGTYKQQLQADAVADEGKNVLAQQALGLDVTKAQTQAQQTAAQQAETRRHNKAGETAASQDVNAYGYSKADWAAKTPAERQKIMKDFKNSTKSPKGKSPWLGTTGQNSFKNDLTAARSVAAKNKDRFTREELSAILTSPNGRPAKTMIVDSKTRKPITKDGLLIEDLATAKGINSNAVKVTAPAIPRVSNAAAVSAALDDLYDGHLSPVTIQKLHEAGIKVNGLGISTKRPVKRVKRPVPPSKVSPIGPVSVRSNTPVFTPTG